MIGLCAAVCCVQLASSVAIAEAAFAATWSIQATPEPTATPSWENSFTGIACESTMFCIAVGHFANIARNAQRFQRRFVHLE
jgi:hypothetical protein